MKKILVGALAAVGIAAFSLPAFALEHEFGGYWRTRAYSQQDYGPNGAQDLTQVDTRTNLYYTAKFSENFKFVNKFEFDTTWGDSESDSGAGGIGTDGTDDFRIQHSYLDMTFSDWNLKVGMQEGTFARGLLFDDNFAGISLSYDGGNFTLPLVWIKATEGGMGKDANDYDVDAILLDPTFTLNDNISINPFLMYMRSDDISKYNTDYEGYYGYSHGFDPGTGFPFPETGLPFPNDAEEANLFYVGLNADFNFDALNLWFTGIYGFGTIDLKAGGDMDMSAFLVALGAEYDFGVFGIHGQAFYASGDDDDLDNDIDAFIAPIGQSYYWSEIMGYKTFDNQSSYNSPNERISNIWAVNLGTAFKPAERWTLEADLWYAQTAEDVETWDGKMDDKLGFELDLAATYEIFDNMSLRFVGAYLFADDATGDDDPWLVGTQLEFSF